MTAKNRLRLAYVATDWAATSVAWLLFNCVRYLIGPEYFSFVRFYAMPQVWGGQIVFPLLMLALYWLSGYYNNPTERSRAQDFLTTAGSALLGALMIFFLAVVNDFAFRRRDAIELLILLTALIFIFVYFGRTAITMTMVRSLRRGRRFKPVVMVGSDPEASRLAESINSNLRSGMGLKVVGFAEPGSDDPVEVCRRAEASTVIISPALMRSANAMPDLFSRLMPAGLTILISPGILDVHASAGRIGNVTGEPLIDITHPRLSESTANVKRVIDVGLSLIALAVLSPLMLGVALAVKLDSPGPVIYRQQRMGRRKREFTILKFRTMVCNAESASGPALSRADDPRITRVGLTLRKYRLDELPQFWNVVRGEMSLVGPRPERRVFADRIAKRVPLYPLIYQVRPGITSWGMVKFGYASTEDEMVERLRYDLIYIENISLSTDLKILLHTIRTVFSGSGK